MSNIIKPNRYRLKEDKIPDKNYYFHMLTDDISVTIKNFRETTDYSEESVIVCDVNVIDENFLQPYTSFYENFDKGIPADSEFKYLKEVIQKYNEYMNSLDFLERVR